MSELDEVIDRLSPQSESGARLVPPRIDELRTLSIFSLTAFAARCCRRLLPLAMEAHEARLAEELVSTGEQFATGQEVANWQAVFIAIAEEAREVFAKTWDTRSRFAGIAWWGLADCLRPFADHAGDISITEDISKHVISAVEQYEVNTLKAFLDAVGSGDNVWYAVEELRLDYNVLHRPSRRGYHVLGLPVDASDSGPLALPLWTVQMPQWYFEGACARGTVARPGGT